MYLQEDSKSTKNITLIIETGIAGGSLALFEGARAIDSWNGSEKISKAEDVLEQIDSLLKKNEIKKTRLQLLKVSYGQGSATGLKIGLAIAKGLAGALQVSIVEVDVLSALAATADFDKRNVISVLSAGKNLFYARFAERAANGYFPVRDNSTENIKAERLIDYFRKSDYGQIVFDSKAFEYWRTSEKRSKDLIDKIKIANESLAIIIGQYNASDNVTR